MGHMGAAHLYECGSTVSVLRKGLLVDGVVLTGKTPQEIFVEVEIEA